MTEVSFVGLEASDSLRDYAERKASALVQEPELQSCRVVLEANGHSKGGKRFRAKFEIVMPRQKIVVGAQGEAYDDMYAAIDASFDDAKRAIHDHAAKSRETIRRSN
jgi:ribosome-associated translation inhibitor RaiA